MKTSIMKDTMKNKANSGIKKSEMAVLAAVLAATLFFTGCGKKKEEPLPPPPETVADEPDTIPDDTVPDEEEDTHEGEAKSLLTGEWIDEEVAAQRPVSCMIGNTDSALPQYGIGQADIIYEAPVEGGLTRLMAVFQDYKKLEKLGSVRSSRLYYAYYSMEYDAIYLHYGQASYAQGFLESGQIDDLNGLEYAVDQAVIYRDTSKRAPHNAYATGEGLLAGIKLKQYEINHPDGYKGNLQFAEDDAPVTLSGSSCRDAVIVKTGYQVNHPYFAYNSKDGLYYRYQYGAPQIDGTDASQLVAKNIILLHANVRRLDDKGYLAVDTQGSGTGCFVTNGKAIDITWERTDNFSPTRYYDSDGKEITLNQGKTWVCIIDNARLDSVQIHADASGMQ